MRLPAVEEPGARVGYADIEEQRGYAATLRLHRLVFKKRLAATLEHGLPGFHVKGNKLVWPY